MTYHATIQDVYRQAAEAPDSTLCCVPTRPLHLPGLVVPPVMQEMNYGCGSTVHIQDMAPDQRVLYVGVGGGLEALQLAYFTRTPGGVIGIEPVAEMRAAARRNLALAAEENDWFDASFVDIRDGDALDLPVDDSEVDLAAQNCLFNIFKTAEQGGDLERALAEMHRALKLGGRLVMSDPVTPRPIPDHLREDERLRAQCLSGCLRLEEYLEKIVEAGFGSIEVRSRRPYRALDAARYGLEDDLLLETIEVAAFKVPMPEDGPCIFTGREAIYTGPDASFDDGKGHVFQPDIPLSVCDKTARALAALRRDDLIITQSTWHYAGGGCC
ncbi:MAG: arsenosugar biosynthesis arsenite methyltransferase ArsM [Planctomycetota bacterium]|nr:arsenosugar biosynthesis arsenite methyltransferase ArsM [Planctomycetota bacterium]